MDMIFFISVHSRSTFVADVRVVYHNLRIGDTMGLYGLAGKWFSNLTLTTSLWESIRSWGYPCHCRRSMGAGIFIEFLCLQFMNTFIVRLLLDTINSFALG